MKAYQSSNADFRRSLSSTRNAAVDETALERSEELIAAVESLPMPEESRRVLLQLARHLKDDLCDLQSQLDVMQMGIEDARIETLKAQDKLEATFLTNPGKFEDAYEQVGELGRGQQGVVWEVRERHDPHRVFACKVISRRLRVVQDEMHNEVRALSSVRCEHIVSFIESYGDENSFYIILEKLNGGELFDDITKRERYSEHDARVAFRQIMKGVRALQHQNIVHRDLKPENLLLASRDSNGLVKIADFGFATQIPPGTLLRDGVGSPNYIAPEVLKCLEFDDHEGYGLSVDMWGAGVILYVLLCGSPPFFHESSDELYDAILGCKYAMDGPIWDGVSEDAKELVRSLLEGDTTKRLNPNAVLAHKWMVSDSIAEAPRPEVQRELQSFNAKRRWKSSILAVVATNRFKTMVDMHKVASSRRRNSVAVVLRDNNVV